MTGQLHPAVSAPGLRSVALTSLRGERDFRRVRRLGATIRSPLFTLRVTDYRPRYGQPWRPAAQIGIVIPKKVLKSAVKRNRVRRRVREALRTLPQATPPQPLPPCRAILFPTAAVLNTPYSELQAALATAMTQVPAKAKAAQAGRRPKAAKAKARAAGADRAHRQDVP